MSNINRQQHNVHSQSGILHYIIFGPSDPLVDADRLFLYLDSQILDKLNMQQHNIHSQSGILYYIWTQ